LIIEYKAVIKDCDEYYYSGVRITRYEENFTF